MQRWANLNYNGDGTFKADDFVPLILFLEEKYNIWYDKCISLFANSSCEGPSDKSECERREFKLFYLEGNTYERYGIDDEIKSDRD